MCLLPALILGACTVAHFAGGTSLDLAGFLHDECGVPAFVAGNRQFGPLTLEKPNALRRYDFLGERLSAVVPDQRKIAIADDGLPYPHDVLYNRGSVAPPKDPVTTVEKCLTIQNGSVTCSERAGFQSDIKTLASLHWGKKIVSNWFSDKCVVAACFDKLTTTDFWRYVADSTCSKVIESDREIKIQVDYDALKRRWARNEQNALSQDDYRAEGPVCEARVAVLNRVGISAIRKLIDDGPTFVRVSTKSDPALYDVLRAYVEVKLRAIRNQAAEGDSGSLEMLKLIRGAEPIVTLSSHDFVVNIALQGPKPNWIISI